MTEDPRPPCDANVLHVYAQEFEHAEAYLSGGLGRRASAVGGKRHARQSVTTWGFAHDY